MSFLVWPPYTIRSARKMTMYYISVRHASGVDTTWELFLNDTSDDIVVDHVLVPAGVFEARRVLVPPIPVLSGESIYPVLATTLPDGDSMADATITVTFDVGIVAATRERRLADAALRTSRPMFATTFRR
jgi:hypothetical protein